MKKNIFAIIMLLQLLFVGSASAMNVSVSVPERGAQVKPGERLYFELAIKYPENNRRKDLRLYYSIKTQAGETLSQTKVLRAIETQSSFMDFVLVPKALNPGSYVLDVVIEDYEDLHKEVSTGFEVISEINKTYLLVGGSIAGFLLLIVLLLIWQIVMTRLRWRSEMRNKHDYSNIPLGERIYYEMISSAIAQMRSRVGRRAITLAQSIDGITVSNQGRVDSIERDPAETLAELVHLYKQKFNKDVSFAIK